MKPFKLIALLAAILLFQTPILANYQSIYIPDQLRKDISEGKVSKYQVETIPTATLAELKQRAVLGANATLTKNISGTPTFDAIMAADICKVDNPQAYTSTIYEMDLPSGIITCMYAAKSDLYNPMGLFKVSVPEIKAYYAINSKAAKTAKAAEIAAAEGQFAPLLAKKQEISSQMQEQTNASFLTIPELLTAAVLTDDEIIDIEATKSTGKFQLKSGYTSKFTESSEVVDNSEYLLADAASIFTVYAGLASVSMDFLIIMIVGFGAYGAIQFFGKRAANKLEDKKTKETALPYIAGLMAGVILFFPVGQTQTGIDDFELLKNRYQEFERFGYYTFSDWAKQSAKVIIDSEMDGIILKSGLGTKEQIVSTTAQKTQSEKLETFFTANYNTCTDNIYKSDYLTHSDGKTVFGETDKVMFPSTEHWAYVAVAAKSLANGHYDKGDRGSLQDGAAGEGEYPKIAFSACGKADYLSNFHKDKKTQLAKSYDALVQSSSASPKISGMERVINFQYDLFRDWGYLSVLGLPIIKMEAARISGLKNQTSEVLEKLDANIAGDNKIMHSILSSIPYMFVPGAKNVFDVVKENGAVIGGISGAVALGSQGGDDGILSGFLTALGGVAGAAAGSTDMGAGAIGVAFAYQAAKILITLLPILGVVVIGVLRFIIIILKIFSFHFLSLFIMPVIFINRNVEAMAKLTAKALATMLEIPIFVLSVWMAVTANSLVSTTGGVFSKKILGGMLENNMQVDLNVGQVEVVGYNLTDLFSKMLIYMYNGFFEVAIAAFSVVIVYKIIISLHSDLLTTIDLSTSSAIDNSIESMKSEAGGWGSRI